MPQPKTQPRPPVVVACTSPATADLAAARGLPMLLGLHMTDEQKAAMIQRYAATAHAAGHDPAGVEHVSAMLAQTAETREQARSDVRTALPGWLADGLAGYRPVAQFDGAKFGGVALFSGAQFGGSAEFSGAEFGGVAGFGGTKFGGVARFGEAKFGNVAVFGGVEFGGDAVFGLGNAVFGGEAVFGGAVYGGRVFDPAEHGVILPAGEPDFTEGQGSP